MFFMTENIDLRTNNTSDPSNSQKEIRQGAKEKVKKPHKLKKWHKYVSAAFLGFTLASCAIVENDKALVDPAERDPNPIVQKNYQLWQQEQRGDTENDNVLDLTQRHEPFEIPADDQRIFPDSRVRVTQTAGYGLNIRTDAGIDNDIVANVADGTVFKVIELAGEKDNYNWVLLKSEAQEGEREIVGYAVTDWLQVLREKPVQ
jgi:hypothetical protein